MAKSKLATALERLAWGDGVQRDDLREALNGELKALRDAWEIDTRKTGDAVGLAVARNLRRLVDNVTPFRPYGELPVDVQRDQFFKAVKVCFNLMAHPDLSGRDLSGRQKWLSTEWTESLRISQATSRRWLGRAIAQIEQQMLAPGYSPLAPDEAVGVPDLELMDIGIPPEQESLMPREPVAMTAPIKRRVRYVVVASAAFVVFLVGGVIYFSARNSTSASQATPSSATTCVYDACPAADVPSPVSAQPGSLNLMATFTQEDSLADTAMVAFTPNNSAAAKFMDARSAPDDKWSFFRQELKAGAFATPGLELQVELETTSQRAINITDIKPIHITRLPIVLGDAISIGSQGGGESVDMTFNMDKSSPTAEQGVGQPEVGQPYFGPRSLTVSAGTAAPLTLIFNAFLGAYTFEIEVDYELNGAQYPLILTDDGKPFRITASPCAPYDGASLGLTQMQMNYLNSLHYQGLNERMESTGSTPGYIMVKSGPTSCPT